MNLEYRNDGNGIVFDNRNSAADSFIGIFSAAGSAKSSISKNTGLVTTISDRNLKKNI